VADATGIDGGFEHERRFELFGSHVRLLIGEPLEPGLPSPEVMALQLEGFLRVIHNRLSRFDPESELCAVNSDPAESRKVSPTMAVAIQAAVWAADRSSGLIDPVVVDELEQVGYGYSRANIAPAPIEAALAIAPARRPAKPRRDADWRQISIDPEARVITRPPGIRIDTGGTGKGLAADLAAERLTGYATHVVDAGGDIRIGGERPLPRRVRIDHPLREGLAHELTLDAGAVATSGIKTRVWRTGEGFAHHLLDPSTGEPAWTGVAQASAIGRTALEAETLAKMAFLGGPDSASDVLTERGGLIALDDGTVERFGRLAGPDPLADEPDPLTVVVPR
jgi:thiamine biosynthesis lipoprotein